MSKALHKPELLPNVTSSEDFEHTSHHIVFKKVDRPISDEYSDFCECNMCQNFRFDRIQTGCLKTDLKKLLQI